VIRTQGAAATERRRQEIRHEIVAEVVFMSPRNDSTHVSRSTGTCWMSVASTRLKS
jgi:hypothetical protein